MDKFIQSLSEEHAGHALKMQRQYKSFKANLASVAVALREGGMYNVVFEHDPIINKETTAPTTAHAQRVEHLILQLKDLVHRHDDNRTTNYYGVVGVDTRTLACIVRLNEAKTALKRAIPERKIRISGGIPLSRAIINWLEPDKPRISMLSLTRTLPIAESVNEKGGQLRSIRFNIHTNHKAQRVSLNDAYEIARKWAETKGKPVDEVLNKLPSDDGYSERALTIYDKRGRTQGDAQLMYANPGSKKKDQRAKKISMPIFYDAQVGPDVKTGQSIKQKNQRVKSPARNTIIDMGDMSLCWVADDPILKKLSEKRAGAPF